MAFRLKTMDNVGTPPIVYLPAKAGKSYALGEALIIASGVADGCGATSVPAYICAGNRENAAADDTVPAIRVQTSHVYEAPLSAGGSALAVGDKVTLGADRLSVTATTASGVAEIVAINGVDVGDPIDVRFSF